MIFLSTIAIIFITLQILFIVQIFRHYRYVLRKFAEKHVTFLPKVALIVPCKGLDTAFDRNIRSFYQLDYSDFEIIFVTESDHDPAYNHLLELKGQLQSSSKAFKIRVVVAGLAGQGSQKLHNLLCACNSADDDVEVFAFADSDICVHENWLSSLVYPLRKEKYGVSTGYRLYVPLKNNLATLALSALNAKVAEMLGPTMFNCAWGGSMAIRVSLFRELGIDKIWQKAASDDLTITREVKRVKKRVALAPGCFVASFEETTWPGLFEFARRQYIITKVTVPGTWWFGFLSSIFSILGLWGFGILTFFFWYKGVENWDAFVIVPIVFFTGQLTRAFLRQKMIPKLLPAETEKMKAASRVDIIGSPFWSWLMFFCIASSAFGRTINWRGVKYKLAGPSEVIRP
ncbi:MAG: glycosyltransferase family 2 protein [Sedimentisphaerales bacterium]|nr:glycosyltransferase family 2 protein [Sedimentisphaerales bacterium]